MLALWLSGVGADVMAAGRVALVIGNGDYTRFGDLRNPANDARAMARKLQSLGFDLVGDAAHVDATRQAMARLLRELEDALAQESGQRTTALVYYSGHGVAEAGSNWLVPVDDGDIRYREDVPDFAIGARSVMRRLEGRGGGLNIVVLDACRNNPLPSRRKTKGALSRGLARMDAPSQTVIVYAAAPGKVAYDGEGKLSPFTGALLEEMDRPGRRLVDVLGATAAVVERETSGMPQGRQEPWLEMKPLRQPFYFVPPPVTGSDNDESGVETGGEGSGGSEAGGQIVKAQRMETERKFWASVEDSRNPAKFRAYLEKYGDDGEFSQLARIELEALEGAGGGEAQRPVGVARRVGERFRDCDGTWCPELVVVPSGSYMMGSPESEAGRDDDEGPRHRVRIGKPFAVGVTEVTRGEFGRFVRETGHSTGDSCRTYEDGEWDWRSGVSWRNPGFSQTDGHPVVCVSWADAQAYVKWLSRETGQGYRLPSEAEWEYVARGGKSTARYWGESESGQCRHANGADRALKRRYSEWEWTVSSCDDGHVHTAPAGTFSANAYGLRDVLGNVWEWVEDCWNEGYTGAPSNGSAWESGDCTHRVFRGGSWDSGPWDMRSAYRVSGPSGSSGSRFDYVGFRVARTMD